MISRNIILKDQKETIEFVSLAEKYPYSVIVSADFHTMDAKTILGMLAMGFNHILKMDIYAEKADDMLEAVEKFIFR